MRGRLSEGRRPVALHTALMRNVQQDRPFWHTPHRPLFLLAALTALAVPAVWLLPYGVGPEPVAWHLHELLFGMGGAAIGGYLLTSLPAWTKHGPIAPSLTVAMCILWAVSRLSFLRADALPDILLTAGTQAYLATLAALVAWHTLTRRIWSKAYLALALLMLIASDLLYLAHLREDGVASAGATEVVLGFALLICLVGGRAVPAFTRSWLERQTAPSLMRDSPVLSALSLGALVCGGLLAFAEAHRAAGLLLILSGALQIARLLGWQTWSVRRYPALLLLHLAWIWLPAGLLLLGLAMLRPEVIAAPAAIHALTMGAMGTMILAIMARSVMARRDDRLVLSRRLALAFALVWLSALLRVLTPVIPSGLPDPIRTAAIFWMTGWMLFLCTYVPALRRPVPRPILSARLTLP